MVGYGRQLLLCAALGVFLLAHDAAGGTWTDHFHKMLAWEWTGDTADFRLTANGFLEGQSALPIAPSPLNMLEISVDSRVATITCWINVVAPNTRVCTKGALVLRHNGTSGYAFALHQATQTVEVYRLDTGEMLLLRAAEIKLGQWYLLRAELNGPEMQFFVDGKSVGTVTDTQSTSGKVGIAVQDAESVLFDDFRVTGPAVVGNVEGIAQPALTFQSKSGEITLQFTAEPGYDYFVQRTSTLAGHDWATLTNFTAKIQTIDAVIALPNTAPASFYRVEKLNCLCD